MGVHPHLFPLVIKDELKDNSIYSKYTTATCRLDTMMILGWEIIFWILISPFLIKKIQSYTEKNSIYTIKNWWLHPSMEKADPVTCTIPPPLVGIFFWYQCFVNFHCKTRIQFHCLQYFITCNPYRRVYSCVMCAWAFIPSPPPPPPPRFWNSWICHYSVDLVLKTVWRRIGWGC